MSFHSLTSNRGRVPAPEVALATEPGKPKLRVSVISTLIGQGFFAACQWAMLVVLAKAGAASAVGEYALALAITAPLQLFTDLALRTLQATDGAHNYSFRDYFGLRVISVSLIVLATLAILAVTEYPAGVRLVILSVALLKSLESLGDIFYGLFQQSEKMTIVSASLALRGASYIVSLYLTLRFFQSLPLACFSLVVARTAILIFHDAWRGFRLLRSQTGEGSLSLIFPRWDRVALRGLFLRGLPSGAAVGVMSFNTNFPRYILSHYMGVSSLGLFAAYSNLILTLSIVVDAIGQAVVPRLASYYLKGRHEQFRRLLGLELFFAVGLAVVQFIGVLFWGETIVRLVYRESYAVYPVTFRVLALGAVFLYSNALLGYALMATEAFRFVLISQLVSTCAVIGASFLLIPWLGLTGAALALVATAVTCSVAYVCGLWHKLPGAFRLPGARGARSRFPASFFAGKTNSDQ